MTEKQEISVSLEDVIYKQAQSICDKLNDCFLDFNDFGNYKKKVIFGLYRGNIYHATDSTRQNKLYFQKYQSYKSGGRDMVKTL